jgi:hypothetical protein
MFSKAIRSHFRGRLFAKTKEETIIYFGIIKDKRIIGLSSIERDIKILPQK